MTSGDWNEVTDCLFFSDSVLGIASNENSYTRHTVRFVVPLEIAGLLRRRLGGWMIG